MSVFIRPELWEQFVFSLCGGLAFAACITSAHLIYKHLRHWANPKQQKLIVRLLLMVPIYSVDSFFSLRWRVVAPYLNCARDAYEGYALFCFFSLLLAYVEGESGDCGAIISHQPPVAHPFGFCWLPKFQPGPVFLLWAKRMILQFALVKPLIALLSLILEPLGLLGDGSFKADSAFLYFTVITNVSVFFALYYLVLFYLAAKQQLEKYSPVGKFLSIKSILFFTFWQGVIIAALNHWHVLTVVGTWSEHEVAVGLQDFAICLEMFLLSIVHIYVFEFQSYQDSILLQPNSADSSRFVPWQKWKPVMKNFVQTISQGDVIHQVGSVLDRQASIHARKQQEALFSAGETSGSEEAERVPLLGE